MSNTSSNAASAANPASGTCPYCLTDLVKPTRARLPDEATADHVFPEFLGGRRTIPACRSCNNKFGHSFEGAAADLLIRPYVQLAMWKVPLAKTNQWWNRACKAAEAELHLSVGEHGIEARATKPIIIRDAHGKIEEAYFPDSSGREKFLRAMAKRDPGAQWIPAEKRIDATLAGLRLQFEIGAALQQLALKICISAGTLLPKVRPGDSWQTGQILRAPASDPHPIVSQYFTRYETIERTRPPLAHTVYVEHVGTQLRGLVQFFGVIQLHCNLASQTEAQGQEAILGWVDPVSLDERFETIPPIGLIPPARFNLIPALLDIAGRFCHAASLRGGRVGERLEIRFGPNSSDHHADRG